jgi:hypothetical protein
MKAAQRLATVIDLDEARRKRARVARRGQFGINPPSSAGGDASLPVTLINGTVLRVDASDLSPEGITLRTTEANARTLYAPGQFLGAETPTVEIRIDLPGREGRVRVLACCRLIHFEMLSPEEVNFTLEFLAFAGAGEEVLRHFLRIRAIQQVADRPNDAQVFALGERRGR